MRVLFSLPAAFLAMVDHIDRETEREYGEAVRRVFGHLSAVFDHFSAIFDHISAVLGRFSAVFGLFSAA